MLLDRLPFIRRDVLSFEHTPQPGRALAFRRQRLLCCQAAHPTPDVHLVEFFQRAARKPIQQNAVQNRGGYQAGFAAAAPLNDTRLLTFPRLRSSCTAVLNTAPTNPVSRTSI